MTTRRRSKMARPERKVAPAVPRTSSHLQAGNPLGGSRIRRSQSAHRPLWSGRSRSFSYHPESSLHRREHMLRQMPATHTGKYLPDSRRRRSQQLFPPNGSGLTKMSFPCIGSNMTRSMTSFAAREKRSSIKRVDVYTDGTTKRPPQIVTAVSSEIDACLLRLIVELWSSAMHIQSFFVPVERDPNGVQGITGYTHDIDGSLKGSMRRQNASMACNERYVEESKTLRYKAF